MACLGDRKFPPMTILSILKVARFGLQILVNEKSQEVTRSVAAIKSKRVQHMCFPSQDVC